MPTGARSTGRVATTFLPVQINDRDRADQGVGHISAGTRRIDSDLAGGVIDLDFSFYRVGGAIQDGDRSISKVDAVDLVTGRISPQAPRRPFGRNDGQHLQSVGINHTDRVGAGVTAVE